MEVVAETLQVSRNTGYPPKTDADVKV